MLLRVSQAIIKYLKVLLTFSVMLLFVNMSVNVFFAVRLSSLLLGAIVLQAFLCCACILIPIKWLKILAQIFAVLAGLTGMFFLTLAEKLSYTDVELYVYAVIWLGVVFSAVKSMDYEMQSPAYAHLSNISFFKKFSVFIAIVIAIYLAVLYFVNSAYITPLLTGIAFPMIMFLVTELLLIRVSRDAIYLGIKALNKQTRIWRYLLYTAEIGAVSAGFFLLRNTLNAWWQGIIAFVTNLTQNVVRLWGNLVNYLAALNGEVQPPLTQDELADLLEDFGVDPDSVRDWSDNFGNGGNFGSGGNGGGGIGSVDGMLGDLPTGDFNYAGLISNIPMSESGEISSGGGVGGGNYSAMAAIRTSKSCVLYLKLKSFGDYDGQGFIDAVEYGDTLDGDSGMNYLAGTVLYGTCDLVTVDIQSFTGQYFLPDYIALSDNYEYSSDVMVQTKVKAPYTVECYDYSDVQIHSSASAIRYAYRDAANAYSNFVKSNYLHLPSATETAVRQYLYEKGVRDDMSTLEKVNRVLDIFTQFTYSTAYDKTLDDQDDVLVSFLQGYSDYQGICQHFAGATVLMMRTLDIPARYVGGLVSDRTTANEWLMITAEAAHAWVEIYQDYDGWIRLDPTGYAQYSGSGTSVGGGSFSQSEYKEMAEKYQQSISGGGSSNGGGILGGDNSSSGDSGSEGNSSSGDLDTDGSDSSDSSSNTDSSSDNSADKDSESGSNGTDKDSSGGGSNSSSSDKDSSGGSEQGSSRDDSSANKTSDEEKEEDRLQSEIKEPTEIPWKTIGIVAGAVVVSGLLGVLVTIICKKCKKNQKISKKAEKEEEIASSLLEEEPEEDRRAIRMVIRDNYKEFIAIAGKHGIRKYNIDTTESLRDKYNRLISTDDAMEILTGLYRIARYDKNEQLTMADVETSYKCLDIIKKSFKKHNKDL